MTIEEFESRLAPVSSKSQNPGSWKRKTSHQTLVKKGKAYFIGANYSKGETSVGKLSSTPLNKK